jgi:hypothetical protein
VTKRGSNFYFWTGIVFLTSQVIFVPELPKREFVNYSLYLASFCWTKSLLCNDAFKPGSAIQSASRRFYTVYKSEKLDPLQPSEHRDIPSGRPTIQSNIRPEEKNFPS